VRKGCRDELTKQHGNDQQALAGKTRHTRRVSGFRAANKQEGLVRRTSRSPKSLEPTPNSRLHMETCCTCCPVRTRIRTCGDSSFGCVYLGYFGCSKSLHGCMQACNDCTSSSRYSHANDATKFACADRCSGSSLRQSMSRHF
jgi:hypothetical protein